MKKFAIFVLMLLVLGLIIPLVGATPPNPTFVLYADNATCGSHCTLTANGGGSFSQDQWGVWGTSPALVVTSGDFLVVGLINFCISSVATRCDITAINDGLGNAFICSTIGNNQLIPGTSAPVIGASICSSLATVSGTEAATNAFTLTVACGACVIGDQYDSEWIVYEYSNAGAIIQGTFTDTASPAATLNAAITTTGAGDTIFGFAYGSSNNRPITYQSSQTNQHAWVGSNGYPAGDLEDLAIGAHNYIMGSSASDNVFEIIMAEIGQIPADSFYLHPGNLNSPCSPQAWDSFGSGSGNTFTGMSSTNFDGKTLTSITFDACASPPQPSNTDPIRIGVFQSDGTPIVIFGTILYGALTHASGDNGFDTLTVTGSHTLVSGEVIGLDYFGATNLFVLCEAPCNGSGDSSYSGIIVGTDAGTFPGYFISGEFKNSALPPGSSKPSTFASAILPLALIIMIVAVVSAAIKSPLETEQKIDIATGGVIAIAIVFLVFLLVGL